MNEQGIGAGNTMANESATLIERQSLEVGKWGSLAMAVAGVLAAYFSRADALLIDGLYSGLNFVSAIIAAKISTSVLKPADQRYPFGYGAYEALYVKFRALVLLGIIVFAVFGAVQKIVTYVAGGAVPELVFGPILVSSIVMVSICMGLAAWHQYNWRRSGSRSELLQTESKAAVVDGVISAGAGGGLLAAGLLRGTALGFIVPVSDSIIVLVMTAFIIREPVSMFMTALREVAGESADPKAVQSIRDRLSELLKNRPFTLLEVAVMKLGRSHFAVSYVKPDSAISGEEADALRDEIELACCELMKGTKAELIIAARGPYAE